MGNVDPKDLPSDLQTEYKNSVKREDLPSDLQTEKERVLAPERGPGYERSSNLFDPSMVHGAALSALHGASAGISDEVIAGVRSVFSDKSYKTLREEERQRAKDFEKKHQLLSLISDLTGSALSPLGLASKLKGGIVGLGALNALGRSEADLTDPTAKNLGQAGKDVAEGAVLAALPLKAAIPAIAGKVAYDFLGSPKDEGPDAVKVAGGLAAAGGTAAAMYGGKKILDSRVGDLFRAGRAGVPLKGDEHAIDQASAASKNLNRIDEVNNRIMQERDTAIKALGDIKIENPFIKNQRAKDRFLHNYELGKSEKDLFREQNEIMRSSAGGLMGQPETSVENIPGLLSKSQLTPEEFMTLDQMLGRFSKNDKTLFNFRKDIRQGEIGSMFQEAFNANDKFHRFNENIVEPMLGAQISSFTGPEAGANKVQAYHDYITNKAQQQSNVLTRGQQLTASLPDDLKASGSEIVHEANKQAKEYQLGKILAKKDMDVGVPASKMGTVKSGVGVIEKSAGTVAYDLGRMANDLENTPGVSHLGKALNKAIISKDLAKQNALLFAIKQNEQARKATGITIDPNKTADSPKE